MTVWVAWMLSGCAQSVPVSTNTAVDGAVGTRATPSLTLNGSPATSVAAGTVYLFQPNMSANGRSLVFSITNRPIWADFDTKTGALFGIPVLDNVGTTSNIEIAVSDGTASGSLAPFSITVTSTATRAPGASGTAMLSWIAPVANSDGTPLTDLAGFRIRYGTTAGDLSQTIAVSGASTTSYTINGLAAGTYYFAVTAYNSAGSESTRSNIASKTI